MASDRFNRIVMGVIAAVAIVLVFEALPYVLSTEFAMKRIGGYFYVWPAIYGLPKVFLAMFLGAYLARSSFIAPAILMSVIGWAFAIHMLNQIAQAAGQHNLIEVAAMNSIGLLIQTGGAVLGAIAGYRFYSTRNARAVDTN